MKAIRFLGVPFVTDNEKMIAWIEGNQDKSFIEFEKQFPGFIACCRKAINELQRDRVEVHRLQYIKGKLEAHPPRNIIHPPSESFIYFVEDGT